MVVDEIALTQNHEFVNLFCIKSFVFFDIQFPTFPSGFKNLSFGNLRGRPNYCILFEPTDHADSYHVILISDKA